MFLEYSHIATSEVTILIIEMFQLLIKCEIIN